LYDGNKEVLVGGLLIQPMLAGDFQAGLEATLGVDPCVGKKRVMLPQDRLRRSKNRWCRPHAVFFLERPDEHRLQHSFVKICRQESFVGIMNAALDFGHGYAQKERMEAFIQLSQACLSFRLVLGRDLNSLAESIRHCMRS